MGLRNKHPNLPTLRSALCYSLKLLLKNATVVKGMKNQTRYFSNICAGAMRQR